MIVTPIDGRLRMITQHDHAHFASELLSLWTTNGLPDHPRRDHLLRAAREHDNGWQEADSAPSAGNGRPHDFVSMPHAQRRDVWMRNVLRYRDEDPYVARLIVRHAVQLHRDRAEDDAWRDVFALWGELSEELQEVTEVEDSELEADYRWIALTDTLSLAACDPRWQSVSMGGFEAELNALESENSAASHTLTIEPFPLSGATTLNIACRWIPDRSYSGDADLGVELATARWQRYAVRVAPAERSPADNKINGV